MYSITLSHTHPDTSASPLGGAHPGTPARTDLPRLTFLDNLRTVLIFLVVLVHAGWVYERSGALEAYWIVSDAGTSDLPGLINLILDVFVMFTIFFISGYLTPQSLKNKGPWAFIRSKARRLLIPWGLAVITLIPLYNVLFLVSRGLPQGPWTTYFHVTNSHISMSWLWFLPALFLFNVAYLVIQPAFRVFRRWNTAASVAAVLALSVGFSYAASHFDLIGWTKTPLIDFQNERLLPHFLVFLLGAQCFHRGMFTNDKRNLGLYITVSAAAWIPLNVYVVVLLNFFLRPGQYLISLAGDRLLLWTSLYLSTLAMISCAVMTFRYFVNRSGRLSSTLNGLSYRIYILHMVVMGPIALALRTTDLPTLFKYPSLAATTFAASTLLALVFGKIRASLPTDSGDDQGRQATRS